MNGNSTIQMLAEARRKTGVRYGRVYQAVGANSRHRLKGVNRPCTYHVMSRTAGGAALFGPTEKEAFREIMRRMEDFSGVRILTYALMDNHFHLLIHIPDQSKFLQRFEDSSTLSGEEKLIKHLSSLYSTNFIAQLVREIRGLREAGRESEIESLLGRFKSRMCDLTSFVKELKERFSRWFNKHHGRRGTLWMGNFKSVVVQDGLALRTMAAYIDLNPVRAGYVDDPKDYRWSGYGEAIGGGGRAGRAARGLCRIVEVPQTQWEEKAAPIYRCWLYEDGVTWCEAEKGLTSNASKRRGFSLERMKRVKAELGEIDRMRLLLTQVAYFTHGLVLGSSGFAEDGGRQYREFHQRVRKRSIQKLTEGLRCIRPRRRGWDEES